MSKINIADFIENTEVEGPGKRFALWVQGCFRRCPGCCNPHYLDFVPRTIVESEQICKLIEDSKNKHGIEGVTLLGGEPMLQARGLSEIAKFCREIGLSVMTFTGYSLEELKSENIPYTDELLQYTDLLVDGAFEESKKEEKRNWVGSTNQRFYFLTDFYKQGIEYDERFSHGIELRIRPDGSAILNGFPLQAEVVLIHSAHN
jgi:anaerobic ribonucleoside-triphosphate reductase activating protein